MRQIKNAFKNYLRKYNPELLFKISYYRIKGKWLNTKHPKTLYDHIAYMMFHTNTEIWSCLADKILVRDYVKEKGYADFLPQLYGTYNCATEIDYTALPKQFVLKTNNASATNIIVFDKETIDVDNVNKQLDEWLRIPYGFLTCQPHYSHIKPKILAEELLIDEQTTLHGKMLTDYKFYCINGKPLYVQLMLDRIPNTHEMSIKLYDMNWIQHDEYLSKIHKTSSFEYPMPKSFSKMKEMAAVFSNGFPFMRVDFYEINGKPILGETTFTPGFDSLPDGLLDSLGKLM